MSAWPAAVAAKESRAPAKQRNSTGTPSRAAISRPMSTVTPDGAAGVPWTSTGLFRLSAARSTPDGAGAVTTPAGTFSMQTPYDEQCDRLGQAERHHGPGGGRGGHR